jgi:hypothetical protein
MLDNSGEPVGEPIVFQVPSHLVPLSLMSWRLPPPGLHLGAPPTDEIKGEAWTRYSAPEFQACERAFREASGYQGNLAMKLGDMDPKKFLRFLAKTAHAFAVAELGDDAFDPFLLDLIFDRSRNYCHFIGGEWEIPEPFENSHTAAIYIGRLALPEVTCVSVKLQLFPSYGSPVHVILVGSTKS